MNDKFDDRALDVIAQEMLDWCLSRGCEKLGETAKEYRVQCPNGNCPSREKAEGHKTFDINKNTAQYHCWHCGLKGVGLHGSKGLIAMLESGDFSLSAIIGRTNEPSNFFKPEMKPKEKAEPVMSREEVGKARAKGICDESAAYFQKRGIPETVYRDFDFLIFSYPKGKQLSFMKQPLNDPAIFFPIRNEKGEIVHVHYKLIHGGYYMSPGHKPIYLTKPTANGVIVVVEGIFDALSVYTVGYRCAALLGHEITSNHDLSVFEGKPVVVMLDNDDAGKTSVDTVATTLEHIASEVRVATISPELGKDANDVLVKTGGDKLSELIQEAKVYEPGAMTMKPDEAVVSPDATEATMNGVEKAKSSVKVESIVKDKPKKGDGIVFPQEAWRGIFETYKQAQEGTTEAPEQYHFAVLKTIAGVVAGRTAYVWSGRKLFPNFYSVLIGPTTKSRKSTAASRGTCLLSDVDETGEVLGADPLVLILRGLSTPAGLLAQLRGQNADDNELSQIEHNRAMSTSPHEGYRALIVMNEFASLLRQAKKEQGSGLIQILTDAYDCLPELHNPTKIDPTVAKNVVISMICLSTREWLENTLELADVYGGYVCRNLFYEWTQTGPIPNPEKPDQSLLNEITMKLQSIRRAYENRSKCQVEYQFDSEAQAVLGKWYTERWYAEYPSEVIASATQRIDENVRKLALLYAVLENDPNDLTIHADQLKAAIAVGKYWEVTAIRLFARFGFSKEAQTEIKIIEALSGENMSQRELHRQVCNTLTARQLDNCIKALISIGRVCWITEKYTDTLGRQRTRKLLALNEDR